MGRKIIDLTGHSFGLLTVIKRDESARTGNGCSSRWITKCACGNVKSVSSNALRCSGQTGCGCNKGAKTKFDIPKSAYWRWANMMRRCYKPKSEKDRKNYMDRGITVCKEWHDPVKFWRDMGPAPFAGASIDRINNEGNYEPSNCRWADWVMQNNNRRPQGKRSGGSHFHVQ